uniref:Uncharacterized protein n=1 Tax=Ceratitis capitata TaxID=7213 RepID=W8C5Y6_CERCA
MFHKHFMSLHAISKGQGTMALCVKKPVKKFRWEQQSGVATVTSPTTTISYPSESSIPAHASMPEFILPYREYIEHIHIHSRIFWFVYGNNIRTERERFGKWLQLWKKFRRYFRRLLRPNSSTKEETSELLKGSFSDNIAAFPSIESRESIEITDRNDRCVNCFNNNNRDICCNRKYDKKLLSLLNRWSLERDVFNSLLSKREARRQSVSNRCQTVTEIPTNVPKTYENAESSATSQITGSGEKQKGDVGPSGLKLYFTKTMLNLQRRAVCDYMSTILLAKFARWIRIETLADLFKRTSLHICLLQPFTLVSSSRNRHCLSAIPRNGKIVFRRRLRQNVSKRKYFNQTSQND